MEYYKDKTLLRGIISLTTDSKVVRTAKDKFEILTPTRTYYMSETETERMSSDTWIDKIREVIDKL